MSFGTDNLVPQWDYNKLTFWWGSNIVHHIQFIPLQAQDQAYWGDEPTGHCQGLPSTVSDMAHIYRPWKKA